MWGSWWQSSKAIQQTKLVKKKTHNVNSLLAFTKIEENVVNTVLPPMFIDMFPSHAVTSWFFREG